MRLLLLLGKGAGGLMLILLLRCASPRPKFVCRTPLGRASGPRTVATSPSIRTVWVLRLLLRPGAQGGGACACACACAPAYACAPCVLPHGSRGTTTRGSCVLLVQRVACAAHAAEV